MCTAAILIFKCVQLDTSMYTNCLLGDHYDARLLNHHKVLGIYYLIKSQTEGKEPNMMLHRIVRVQNYYAKIEKE